MKKIGKDVKCIILMIISFLNGAVLGSSCIFLKWQFYVIIMLFAVGFGVSVMEMKK